MPLYPLLNQRSASLNCHMPPPPTYPLLNQRSAPLNCYMSPSTLFSLKGQHHLTVICPPLSPSQSEVSTTQLTYKPLRPFSLKGQQHSNFICAPSTPFLTKGQHHSTVICPPLPPSKSKVSATQLLHVPLYPLLPQRSASLNCHMPTSIPFSIRGQHHSTVI